MLDCLPEDRRDAVRAALAETFGQPEPDFPPVAMAGGMSGAQLFRIRVGGIAYLLRLEPAEPPPFGDRFRAYACMELAARACLAPAVRYAKAADGVAVTELIAQTPLDEHPGDREGLLTELAQSTRLLHELGGFPATESFLDRLQVPISWFRAAGLAGPETLELLERFEGLRAAYRVDPADLVSSHNDLNMRNLLCDGRRLWFIDWDTAAQADRFADLAALANWFTDDPDEERLLLRTYFRRPPTAVEQARLDLMRQASWLLYGLFFSLGSMAEGQVPRPIELQGALSVAEARRRAQDGELDLRRPEHRGAYGQALLGRALAGFRSLSFAEALGRVA